MLNINMEKHMNISVEVKGLKNQINRLEVLRVATCAKSHAFKKYTNEQLETIIEDLKDILLGLETLDKGANN
jgi:archaellum component FlaC